jgi:hypothetical protein
MRGRWAQYRKVLYSAGFDKIHYSGLTIIRRLFFVRQFLFDKFLKALSNDRKNILWIRVRQEFWISRQTKNQHSYFIGQENRFHFSCETHFFDRNFFTIWEIISDAEKDEDNFFTFLFFIFIRQSDCFSCGHKIFNSMKMTKVFSDKKNLRTFFVGQPNL